MRKDSLPLNSKYFNPRISFDGKYWYLAVSIEQECSKTEIKSGVIGIDLGIKELAVCSNGIVFENINKTKEVCRARERAS